MTDKLTTNCSELKPVPCGCGGEPYLKYDDGAYSVMCTKCGIETKGYCNHFDDFKSAKEYATKDWNRAMGKPIEIDRDKERTAKVIEHDASITDTDGNKYLRTEYLCGACEKKVIGGDEYCSHCGMKLDWSGNE